MLITTFGLATKSWIFSNPSRRLRPQHRNPYRTNQGQQPTIGVLFLNLNKMRRKTIHKANRPAKSQPPISEEIAGRSYERGARGVQALLFDLDGTLIDSVYQHVLAWREALGKAGIELAVWRIHRRIGMSGGLLAHALLRETGHRVTLEEAARLQQGHAKAYARQITQVRPLPGARELLAYLSQAGVPWAIATSGRLESARLTLETLGVDPNVVVITRDQVPHAKPDPDLFLAAAERLGVDITASAVIGDSVWDLLAARRARALGVGLLSGGYGQDELERAGAYRVYQDPADLLKHLDEVGIRTAE
jgi:HAD superfamily hydrolase (TIGR01549 family)